MVSYLREFDYNGNARLRGCLAFRGHEDRRQRRTRRLFLQTRVLQRRR